MFVNLQLIQLFPLLGLKKSMLNGAAKLIDKAIGTNVLDNLISIISFSNSSKVDYSHFFKVMNGGMDAVRAFGFALVVTYFLIFLFDAAAKEQITVDSLIKVLIQLVLVVTLINNLGTIVMAFFSIEESMLKTFMGKGYMSSIDLSSDIGTTDEAVTSYGTDIVDGMNKDSIFIAVFFQALMIYLIHFIAEVAIQFAAISRAIEIGWRVILAPIGVANCFEGGASSPGIRYLKSLFATILSGVALYAVTAIGFSLVASFLYGNGVDENSVLLGSVAMLSTAGAAIGVSGKVKEVVN